MSTHMSKRFMQPLFLFLVIASALSQSAHPTSAVDKGQTLKQRYQSIVCAVALIETERGSGTGFFINAGGDMVTAAHVVSSKTFKLVQDQVQFDVHVDQNIQITPHALPRVKLLAAEVDVDPSESSTDLAFIHTGTKPPCWVPLGDSSKVETGDHLLSIGFPGIDNGNPILYEGFLSGRFKHPPNAAVGVVNGRAIMPNYEVLKVQMPITPGASGSPVIDDSGHVVAVVSESPMIWTQDLQNITRVAGSSSGITLSGFDTVSILGQLAIVVREFETTGSGYAVPVSDLRPTRAANRPVATPDR